MTERSPESMLHELDYWKALLDDLREMSDLVSDAADPLPSVSVAALSVVAGADKLNCAHEIGVAIKTSMLALLKMDEPISRMLSLIEGRQLALEAEKVA